MKYLSLIVLIALTACHNLTDAPVPDLHWAAFDAPSAKPVPGAILKNLEGVYTISGQDDDFGKEAVLKSSYNITGKDTSWYVSFFCSEDVRYFICQAKQVDTGILINGYWRNIENTKTGKIHLCINGSASIPNGGNDKAELWIHGLLGMYNDEPNKPMAFTYQRPLFTGKDYAIIAHRGGGRNNDVLPASENSVEMIQQASRMGANGIEIDVQLTKDGIPVLYHDADVDDRLTNKAGIHGKIKDYTLEQLNKEFDLSRGGEIPTLQQALDTVLYNTPLQVVWLDCKWPEGQPAIAALQKEFLEKAAAAGRKLEIYIGVPDEKVMQAFMALPGYSKLPSLCELEIDSARKMNAKVWASSWTKGHQDNDIGAMQAEGRKAFGWTIDIPDKIKEYVKRAKFNGIVTNRPSFCAYAFFSQERESQ